VPPLHLFARLFFIVVIRQMQFTLDAEVKLRCYGGQISQAFVVSHTSFNIIFVNGGT
jgi:hypothetical protein